jgi:hypothetical protein
MWDSFDYNMGNMQYAEDGRGNEMKELISFSLDIPEEMYWNNPSEAEEQILAKALQITQNRKIE